MLLKQQALQVVKVSISVSGRGTLVAWCDLRSGRVFLGAGLERSLVRKSAK